jgi:hypothetical protein
MFFVFTFILSNREEQSFPEYEGPVLVQAASVFNTYIEIR